MRIVSLTAENIKRLKAVYIEPTGDVVVVAGRNAQGKTSVLDAIWLALGGGPAARGTTKPIRDGEATASVTLDLGDLKVTRTWTGDKTALRVENADGARYSSPQGMLDALVGRLSFDPLAFAQQDEKSQRTTLLSLVELPFDPAELDSRRRALFEDRTDVNRTAKALRAQLDANPEPAADLPVAEVSLADLLDKATKARQWQERAQRIAEDHEAALDRVERAKAALAQAEADLNEVAITFASIPKDLPDPAQYDEQIRNVEQVNAAVRQAKARADVLTEWEMHEACGADLTEQLVAIDEQRRTGLEQAAMPIEGLGFDEDGVTYQGVPLKQASAAEQLRVSIAMAMALNPKVRVIRITDGSLLDSTNLALIEQMAADQDFQVWVERVDESGQVGIVIEDGQVVGAEAIEAAAESVSA